MHNDGVLFNTLKNECTNLYEFTTEETLYQKVKNLHTLIITAFVHTVIMVIEPHMKQKDGSIN